MATNNAASAVQNIYRTPELWQKITFTFLCLVLYRIGAHITVPGVDVVALTDFFKNRGGGGVWDLQIHSAWGDGCESCQCADAAGRFTGD